MALTPRKSNRTTWNSDKIITFDIEASDWTEPVALGYLHPDDGYECIHTGNTENPIRKFVDEVVLARKNRNMRFVAHNGGGYDFGFLIPYLIEKEDYEVQFLKRGNGDIFFIKITEEYQQVCDNCEEFKQLEENCNCNSVKHNTYLQDSFALLPRGLDYLTEAYAETANIEMDEDEYDKISTEWESMEEEFRTRLKKYLKNDCVTLKEIIDNFTATVNELADENEVGCSLTMGSTTMNMYRTNYLADEPESQIPQAMGYIEDAFRESYNAGRTEVFRMTADEEDYPLYHYDINSLFPYCYTKFDLPVGKPSAFKNVDDDYAYQMLENEDYGGAVYIEGTVPEDTKYPVLPRTVEPEDADAEKVVFATGEIEGWYMMREINYAREQNALDLDNIIHMIIAENKPQFSDYGSQLYKLKNEIDKHTNPGKYVTVKLLLNSFYGKFAMKRDQSEIRKVDRLSKLDEEGEDWNPVGGDDAEDVSDSNSMDLMSQGVVEVSSQSDADYIIPRIASGITAQARIEMHKWFTRIRDAGGKIYYCDTDSVVCDIPLEEIEPSEGEWVNDELGGMDLESVMEEYYALRPKTYAEKPVQFPSQSEEAYEYWDEFPLDGYVIKAKGMRDVAKDVEYEDEDGETVVDEAVSFEDFRIAFENENPERINCSWVGVRGLSATLKDDYRKGVESAKYSRRLTGFDDKRVHAGNGKDSRPLDISEINNSNR